jgi:hypothetical protein
MLDHLALVVFLGLVVYRATRVATTDKVSQPWRDWLLRKVQESGADNRSLARWAYTLLTCPFCLSVWLSFIIVALWVLWPGDWDGLGEYLFDSVAVAGVVALAVSVDHRLNEQPGP